jgi:hypothetical protein
MIMSESKLDLPKKNLKLSLSPRTTQWQLNTYMLMYTCVVATVSLVRGELIRDGVTRSVMHEARSTAACPEIYAGSSSIT